MVEKRVALTVAGSDSGGGAGVQADIKTMEALGVFGTSAVTSVTAQNTTGVEAVEDVSPEVVSQQIDAVAEDFEVEAAKTGMLSNASIIEVVAEKIDEHDLDVVVDPVMVAQSGDRLLDEDAEEVLRKELVPRATLVTPNIPEAEMLSDIEVDSEKSMETAAKKITQSGANAALVKGGHFGEGSRDTGVDEVVDVLYAGSASTYHKPYVDTENTHGTGCTLSSAVAAELAKETVLQSAVGRAEDLVHRAIRYGLDVGKGYGPVHHTAEVHNEAARFGALNDVRRAVREFRDEDVSPLVPEVGMNFAVATPYALSQDEVAAVEGRIRRGVGGVSAEGVWFGASGHVARYLLTVRDLTDDAVSAACNVRNNPAVRDEVEESFETVEVDRSDEPEARKAGEGGSMEWSASLGVERTEGVPEAVIDGGDHGKEPMIRLAAPTPEELREKVVGLNDAVR